MTPVSELKVTVRQNIVYEVRKNVITGAAHYLLTLVSFHPCTCILDARSEAAAAGRRLKPSFAELIHLKPSSAEVKQVGR